MKFTQVVMITTVALLLGACARPTERGQQYLDGHLTKQLSEADNIVTNTPRNYQSFQAQSEIAATSSEKIASIYSPLYDKLNEWIEKSGEPETLKNYGIEAAQLAGGDEQGNVLFTGYFSPIIELRHEADERFRFPVFAVPECAELCPTRAQIYDGALDGLGLELGYAQNRIDPFIMEVQGSGFVHFGDDNTLEYFAYAGKNNHAYVSIGKVLIENGEVPREKMSLKAIKEWVLSHNDEEVKTLLEQNPSFVFFSPRAADPVTGSAGVPLLPMASVAGDKRLFPMGTPILAEVPLLNADGTWSGTHELRVLLVLDTGGAVTDSHFDLYHGMGKRAGIAAGHYRHFGRVWKLGLDGSATRQPWLLPPEKLQ